MANPSAELQLAKELLDLTKAGNTEALQKLWLERLDEIPAKSGFFKEWMTQILRIKAKDEAEELSVTLVERQLAGSKWNAAMRTLVAVIPYYAQSDRLRAALLTAIDGFYAKVENRERLLALSGLAEDTALAEGFRVFREWVQVTPGQVFQHYDWGEGIVKELDIDDKSVIINFPKEPNKRMKIEGVRKFLKFIDGKHFLARRALEPEVLIELSEQDPAGLIKLAVGSTEEKELKQADLKALLTPSLIPAVGWNTWWGKAREALKADAFIDFDSGGGARTPIRLREKPRTVEDELREQFFAKSTTTAEQGEMIRRLARGPKPADVNPALLQKMAQRLNEVYRLIGEEYPAQRLEVAYMLADLKGLSPAITAPDPEALLASIEDYQPLAEIENVDYAIKAVTALLARDGEAGCEQAARLLPTVPVKLAQAIWKALGTERHADLAVRFIEQLLASPLTNPDTYAWAVRSALDGSWKHLEDYFPAAALVPELVDYIEDWDRQVKDRKGSRDEQAAAKSLTTRMRTLLGANKFAHVGEAVESMNIDAINRLRHKIQTNDSLPSTFKSGVERVILLTRRDLDEEVPSAAGVAPAAASDELLCTAKMYQQKMAELRDLTSVRIPQNAQVIEEARKEGDLRENAGYQYAKEEQKMLMQQKVSLSDQLQSAVVVSADNVDGSRIGFGTSFRVKNLDSNQDEHYTVMGRWEADPERNILSLHAPLAQQFHGRSAGESLTIQRPGGGSTRYEVLSVENALKRGEWD
jgi:transcription elongation factor GreA